VRVVYLAAIAAAAQLATGCARWPDVTAIGDVRFMQQGGGGVRTVELLPIHVGVAAYPGSPDPPEQIAARFDERLRAGLADGLSRHGYRLTADAGEAMFTREELVGTARAFAEYGRDQATATALLSPNLPAMLGRGGADATLFVGGFAYAGEDGGVSAGEVAKWVFIGIFIIVVVVVVAVMAKRSGGGGGGGVKAPSAPSMPRTAPVVVAPRGFRSGSVDLAFPLLVPDGQEDAPSRMWLQMTLVDNRTGEALWHTQADFAASPANDDNVDEAVRRLLMTLPRGR